MAGWLETRMNLPSRLFLKMRNSDKVSDQQKTLQSNETSFRQRNLSMGTTKYVGLSQNPLGHKWF